MAAEKDKTQTADGAAGAQEDAVTRSMQEDAQASIKQAAESAQAAKADTTPDATYVRGAEGNVNFAVPADAPIVTTYEDALEAGYLGVAPGYANTEGYSVAAVTARDRKFGLPGTGAKGAVVNGDDAPTPAKR